MYLLMIVLNREEYLEDVLSCFLELGIEDAITVDAESMKRSLAAQVPIFAGLRLDLGRRPFSKIITATSDDRNTGNEVIRLLKEVDIDLEAPGVCRIYTLKLDSLLGTPETIEEI
ncbi:hypothetical protein CH333_09395 [candidate division WOR-3 bacterium JGI_Cruoil_03_44_89]|uniref:Uncharacterized protein n=1 Tax=candidate division WOR-3 bacterium JGI_Cruoil_03_44_89 TaxID=1973748 RepID=A0A235BP67_UNCW3|nr:MAG: hypothetical protein CH333_09395 [candidate division WOR-3 bacterium JGI_Cruoil_03_44_89]